MLHATQTISALVGPFAMLLNPERVVSAMALSDRLNQLQRRIHRPLDKPLIAKSAKFLADAAEFDRLIDEADDEADDTTKPN